MQTIAKVFSSADEARRAAERIRARLGSDRVSLLMPGMSGRAVEAAAHAEPGEAPGMGAAIGGVVGGAVGLATASLVLPGVGPIVVAGLRAAGALGAAAGGAAGATLEVRLSAGLSGEELTKCLEGLRAGRSVVLAEAEDDAGAERFRTLLDDETGAADWPAVTG